MSITSMPSAKPAKPVNSHIGRTIRDLMFEKNKTQVEMALTLGIDQGSMSRRIRGRTDWSPDELVIVARVLGITVAELFPAETRKGPAGGAARPSLPDLDSNQEPAG